MSFCNANEKTATKKLKGCNWNLEQAVEEYLLENGDRANVGKVDKAKLQELFSRYKDKAEDAILIDGLEQFLNDLDISPMDPVFLVIAHAFNCDKAGLFTKPQFVDGLSLLGFDSLDKIKAGLPSLRAQLDDPDKFRDVYSFSYNYNKEPLQKSLPLEVAIPLWKILLPGKFAKLDDWCEFVHQKHGKAITRDTWTLFLDFVTTVSPDLSNYDDDGDLFPFVSHFFSFPFFKSFNSSQPFLIFCRRVADPDR